MDNDIDDEPPLLVASDGTDVQDGNSGNDTSGARVPITIVTGRGIWIFDFLCLELYGSDSV